MKRFPRIEKLIETSELNQRTYLIVFGGLETRNRGPPRSFQAQEGSHRNMYSATESV